MSGQVHKVVSQDMSFISQDENFVSVGFGIHASNCTRTFLAGKEKGFLGTKLR